MLKVSKDNELKKTRGYTNAKSFVREDGSEVLHKEDWKKRKRELWFRCGGQCEYVYPNSNARCRADCQDAHHIKPRWPVRNDELKNLMGICREHHNLLDRRKIRSDKKARSHDALR